MLVIAECSQAGMSSFKGTAGVDFLAGGDIAVDEDATGVGVIEGVGGFGLGALAIEEETEDGESGGGEETEPGDVAGAPSFRNRFSRICIR